MADSVIPGAAAVAATPRVELGDADVAALSRRLGEVDEAVAWRQQAAALTATVEYPDRVRHLWRYTDPDRLRPERPLLETSDEPDGADLPDTPAVLVQPGRAPRLNDAARASGLEVRPLFSETGDGEWMGRAVPVAHGYFEAINAAAFDAGVLVRAPRGHVAEQPLRLVIPAQSGRDLMPRILVIAEQGASLTVVEDHVGGADEARVIGVTEILAGANADVRHVLVQRWARGTSGHLTQRALLDRDARFLGATATFGGDTVKVDLGGILAGAGGRSEMVGVALPDHRQHFDHHTVHQHVHGHTWSNIDFKAAVAGRARSAYTGLLRIEEDAPSSEAFQENRNLLLSERARADSIPELEILTDDVSCSHGATVAPVDPEQVFYLQSRGIASDEALRLVVRGFVEPTLRQVPEGMREELDAMLDGRLADLHGGA